MGHVDRDEGAAPQMIVELLRARGAEKTICPSEVARALDADHFRLLMPVVRAAARELVEEGRVEVTQRGAKVDIDAATGPVRLGLRR